MEIELRKYIESIIEAESPLLLELRRETNEKMLYSRVVSGHIQGRILAMISKLISPERILEIGTFTGYSALCLAEGLTDNGELITIESNDENESIIKKYFAKTQFYEKLHLVIGDAKSELKKMKPQFDLVFIDADKRDYCEYFILIKPLLKSGGVVLADNTLWDGKVIDKDVADSQTLGIREFNVLVNNDPDFTVAMIPVRDGLTLIRKK